MTKKDTELFYQGKYEESRFWNRILLGILIFILLASLGLAFFNPDKTEVLNQNNQTIKTN